MSNAAVSMDRMYGWQRHIYDLTRKPYLLGRDFLIDELKPPHGGSVLEIGCGTGRNLIAAARRYPDCRLYGLDVSRAMLDTAGASVARAGLAGRIRMRQADATNFDPASLFAVATFDRVFISYSLSMIAAWREVTAAALRLTTPGGSFHVVDFGDQAGLPDLCRLGLIWWLDLFDVHPRAMLERSLQVCAASDAAELAAFRSLYRGYAAYGRVERPVPR